MAMQPYNGASSSSSMVASLKKYDVFISFHGKDTRKTITSHLYEALRKRVHTFIDFKLEKGDEISSALNKAIEGSDASVVIFSKHYASSRWCLNELVKILECKRDRRQIVIPVFYDVEPSDVRNQTGSYQQAFEQHERDLRHNKDKLQKWKDALTEAANLSGWNSQSYRMESDFVNDVVEDVLKQLYRKYPCEVNKGLVGIKKKYEKVELLLEIGSNDVKTIVLWGMGGIGKTTLAEYLYAKLCSQFEHHCFIGNIRKESIEHGLKFVRNKLFCTLLELRLDAPYVETPIFIRRLAYGKTLIVLDDVATLEQAENLNIVNNLGEGSRVIITTRAKEICVQFDECEIYEVEEMSADESLQLFCQNAFGEKCPKDGYDHLSQEAIHYCSGNPLALKVLGANFSTKKSKEVWKSELEKLKKIPNKRIHDVLKLSFDDLDPTQQAIFLDIACLSKSRVPIDYLTAIWNACDFFAESGLQVLKDKALIYFHSEHFIEMHDLLKEMGKEIVMKEAKDPGRRTRLWSYEDVYDILKNNKGTEAVEAIEFEIWNHGDLYLNSDCFKSMTNLRHLTMTMDMSIGGRLYFLEGLEKLSNKLKRLHWNSFPLESLPSTFCAEWLVHLKMQFSKLKKLWDGIKRLDNLMILDLGFSKDLIEIPDLSRAPNLQVVSLSYCVSLCQLHPSIFSAPKLKELCLLGCTKIESLKNNIYSKSLQTLNLSDSSLAEFSVTSEEMMELSLWGTVVHGFSSLMLCNKKFTGLHLTRCTQINTLSLWLILEGTPSLKKLNLSYCCNLEILPDNIQNNSMLEILNLDGCSKLKSIPKLPASLQTLELNGCSKLKSIPKLPASLQTLGLNECRKLKSLPKLPVSLQCLEARNCIHLDTISIQPSILDNMFHRLRSPKNNLWNRPTYPKDFCFFPGGEVPSEFYFHTTKASIVIPKYGLYGFVICIILSPGVNISTVRYSEGGVLCTICQHTEEIDHEKWSWSGVLISDHVLLGCIGCYNSNWVKIGSESGGDHYNLLFKFNYTNHYDKTATWIKSCGVIPVYDWKHSLVLDNRISGVEIVEIQSNAQLSDDSHDIIESQPQEIGAENEDDQQHLIIPQAENMELNDKSSCSCSLGLLLKHILEESKRLFLKRR